MVKKSLIFIVMIVVFVAVILYLVGLNRIDQKNGTEKKKVKMAIPERLEEIRIVAIEEKRVPPTSKAEKRKKKVPVKKKRPPVIKKIVLKKIEAVTLKRSKKTAEQQDVSSTKSNRGTLQQKRFFPAHFHLNNYTIVEGRKLIDKNASVPIVQASYDQIGFDAYLKKMRDIGGRLFVGDAKKQIILAEVIVDNRSGEYRFMGIDEGRKDDLGGMALFRPREISGEILVNEILTYSWQFFQESDLRCVILLPLDKEAAILGALKQYFNVCRYNISQFDIVWGNYFQRGEQFGLKVEKGRISKTREIVSLNMILTM